MRSTFVHPLRYLFNTWYIHYVFRRFNSKKGPSNDLFDLTVIKHRINHVVKAFTMTFVLLAG